MFSEVFLLFWWSKALQQQLEQKVVQLCIGGGEIHSSTLRENKNAFCLHSTVIYQWDLPRSAHAPTLERDALQTRDLRTFSCNWRTSSSHLAATHYHDIYFMEIERQIALVIEKWVFSCINVAIPRRMKSALHKRNFDCNWKQFIAFSWTFTTKIFSISIRAFRDKTVKTWWKINSIFTSPWFRFDSIFFLQ